MDEMDRQATTMLDAMATLLADGQPAAARRIRDAHSQAVIEAADKILDDAARHWFASRPELEARYVTADDPAGRAEQTAELDRALASAWADWDSHDGAAG